MPTSTLNVGVLRLDQGRRCVNPDQQALLQLRPLRKPRRQLKNNIKKYLTFDLKYDIIYSVLRYILLIRDNRRGLKWIKKLKSTTTITLVFL